MKAVKFVAEVAEEHAIEAGAEDVTSVEGDDQVQLAQYSDLCVDPRHCFSISYYQCCGTGPGP
jgi:hypothetical protein